MNSKNLLNLVLLGSALTFTAVGCKTGPQNARRIPGNPRPVADTSLVNRDPRFTNGRGIADNQKPFSDNNNPGIPLGPGHTSWQVDPSAPLASQTIYFEFDKASVKSSEHGKLDAVAAYLRSHGQVAVRVEGNCDERGTEEYNRALGERRALAAREYLVHLGINADQIDTITYGEDKPADPGHSEAAWSKNRRDEFQVLLPPKP